MILIREIRFEEPPAPCRTWKGVHGMVWPEVASELVRRPGEWARIAVLNDALEAGQYAHRIRNGRVEALAAHGEFEAVVRTVAGERRLYARFLGGAA